MIDNFRLNASYVFDTKSVEQFLDRNCIIYVISISANKQFNNSTNKITCAWKKLHIQQQRNASFKSSIMNPFACAFGLQMFEMNIYISMGKINVF